MKTTTIMKTTENNKAFMKLEKTNSEYLTAFFKKYLTKNVDYCIIPDELKTSCDAITFEIDTLLSKAYNISLIESKIRNKDYSQEGFTLDFAKWSSLKKITEQNNFNNILYINFVPSINKIFVFDITNLTNNDFNQERTVHQFTVIESAKIKRKYVNLPISEAIFTADLNSLDLTNTNEKIDIKNLNMKDFIYLNESIKIINLIKK